MNKIVYIMGAFMLFIIGMVLYITFSVKEKPVADYYEKDLRYQQFKDSVRQHDSIH